MQPLRDARARPASAAAAAQTVGGDGKGSMDVAHAFPSLPRRPGGRLRASMLFRAIKRRGSGIGMNSLIG